MGDILHLISLRVVSWFYNLWALFLTIVFWRSLDLTGPLLLGGSLPLPTTFPVPYKHFTGCIANVAIDHVFLDLSRPMYVNGTTAGCPGMQRDYCTRRPCQRGNCSSILKSHRCDCPSGYGGRSCQTGIFFSFLAIHSFHPPSPPPRILPNHCYAG